MSQPSYYLRGSFAQRTDTRLVRWTRILGAWQNVSGADSRNNPRKGDTLRQTLVKLAKALSS